MNLSGESIAGKRWTDKRKKEILQSRLQSAALLRQSLNTIPHTVKAIICASAIGYYGNRIETVNEESKKGIGFLADTVEDWENENKNYPARTVIFRFGNVLSAKGGVLAELKKPLYFFACPFLGGGKQLFSWIHIDDLCNMIQFAISDYDTTGIYNAVAPEVVSQKQFMLTLKKAMNKFALKFAVPSWVLKLVLGEQAALVLDGANVSSIKIQKQGFVFRYAEAESALKQILKNE